MAPVTTQVEWTADITSNHAFHDISAIAVITSKLVITVRDGFIPAVVREGLMKFRIAQGRADIIRSSAVIDEVQGIWRSDSAKSSTIPTEGTIQ